MDSEILKKSRKKIFLILIINILCIIMISFLPWIQVTENNFVKENLHFNYEMMVGSSNIQINELSKIVMNINILFWIIFAITLISIFLITYYTLKKSILSVQILILTSSFIIFIICFLIIYIQIIFSRMVNDIDFISASMFHTYFAYPYIQFIFSIILLFYSATYSKTLLSDSIKELKKSSKKSDKEIKKVDEKKTPDNSREKEIEELLKEPIVNTSSFNLSKEAKLAEIDRILGKNEPSTSKENLKEPLPNSDLDKEKQIESSLDNNSSDVLEEKQEEFNKDNEIQKKEDKNILEPFPIRKQEKKIEDNEEIHLSETFEKALSSAIDKKQLKIKQQKPEKKDEKQDNNVLTNAKEVKIEKPVPIFRTENILLEKKGNIIYKIFNFKCPECNHIFPFDKKSDNQKIKCPNCGKEGTIEKEI